MDDMNAFDRQLASVVLQRVGPSRPVNDAAIFTTITATQSPRWRFQSLLSASRLVVAGGIVALFGGFLLAGVLTQPSEEAMPAAVTDSPRLTSGLLPGVDLVTEEVEPGVYRVVSDGVGHDLDERHPSDRYDLTNIAITPDGTVWLSAEYSLADNDVNPPGPLVWALGRPGVYTPEDGVPENGHTLVADEDGTLLMVGEQSIVRFDGTGFVPDDRIVRRLSTSDELWTIPPAQLAGMLEEGAERELVMDDPRRFLVAVWIWNGWTWYTLDESGRSAGGGDTSYCWIDGGIRCDDTAQVSTYLEGTEITELAPAADGSVWAVGDHDGGGGGLYRISPE